MKGAGTLLLTLILSGFSALRCGATVYYSDGTAASVQSVHNNQAQDGDTITLPSGTFTWTTGVTISKQITLQGAGTNATGGGDQTTLVDNIAANQPVVSFSNSTNTLTVRMTGITVKSGTGGIKDGGTCTFDGPMNLRIDHCHFVASSINNYRIVNLNAAVFGVLDHCILDLTGTNAVYIANGRRGSGDIMGNLEWTLPTNFGSADYFFIEDNIINGDVGGGAYSTRIFDGFTGAKVVVRFNNVHQATMGETHATGHSGDDRGLRSQEVYGNAATSSLQRDPNFVALDMGSGTTVVWGNTWNNVYKNIYHFNVTRKNNDTYNQTATPGGWGYAGTDFNGTGSNWDGGTVLGTDTVLGYPMSRSCRDAGKGDLLVGFHPNKVNATTGTIHWPNQALEPIYMWNNAGRIVAGWGGSNYDNNTAGRVVAERDYRPSARGIQTSTTTPFNGSSGTGWGTLANRPTSCTTGVAYFATDQGSWNTSSSNPYGVQQNGADGVLYKCTSTNTWTLYYTPYTYPHPLVTGKPATDPNANCSAAESYTDSNSDARQHQYSRLCSNG